LKNPGQGPHQLVLIRPLDYHTIFHDFGFRKCFVQTTKISTNKPKQFDDVMTKLKQTFIGMS